MTYSDFNFGENLWEFFIARTSSCKQRNNCNKRDIQSMSKGRMMAIKKRFHFFICVIHEFSLHQRAGNL